MRWYDANGYAPEALTEYVMTLLNSNYEEWRNANPAEPFEKFPFSIKKMSTSGCLLDMDKLTDVSKNTIAAMSAEKVYDSVLAWARQYERDFAVLLERRSGVREAYTPNRTQAERSLARILPYGLT